MPKVYGYARVSTETQSERGYGLDAQQESIRKYAAENGLDIETIFVDAGISGAMSDTDDDDAITKRTGLMDLLAAIETGDTVIVHNTSRIWRSDLAKALIRRMLKKKKIKLISVEQPHYDMYAANPNERLIEVITEALDEWERSTIALKLARGRTTKAKGGDKPAGICPYGYRYAADKKSVEIHPEESKTVRTIYSECQKGMSLKKIAEMLTEQGAKTRNGGEWQTSSVKFILNNKFYTGVLQHQGAEIKGNHEPIISKVQFGKCQSQLNKRKRG